MRRRSCKPGVLFLGFNQFVGLLSIIDPRAPAPVLTALFQTGIPHRPARISGLLRQLRLGVGQFGSEPLPAFMPPQPNANHRQTYDNTKEWAG